jgi:hypothetical protein
MKLDITSPTPEKPTKWPRLMLNKITGTIFLVASLEEGDAVDLEHCHFVPVRNMANNLEELPVGYTITLTNE